MELSVMEQRHQAVLAVVQDGWRVTEVAERLFGLRAPCLTAKPAGTGCIDTGVPAAIPRIIPFRSRTS